MRAYVQKFPWDALLCDLHCAPSFPLPAQGPNVYVNVYGTICSWATTLTGVFGSVSTCPAPPPSPPSPPPTTDDQMGVIIGVTVGVVLALAIALVILHRYCREKVNLTAWKPWNPHARTKLAAEKAAKAAADKAAKAAADKAAKASLFEMSRPVGESVSTGGPSPESRVSSPDDFASSKGRSRRTGERRKAIMRRTAAAADKAAEKQVRLTDITDEPLELMGPIMGVMKSVRLSLMDAAAASGVEDIDGHAFMASEAGGQLATADPHGLDADEAGALWLYTAESDLYPTLNQLLRTRDRSALKPFYPYLQLMLTARSKLPKYTGSVWRGVKGIDLRAKYPTDKEVWWWAFSSTTKQLKTLTTFLGTSGVRTVFMIEIFQGVDLQRYSAFQGENSEAEVLLYPGTKLKVVGSMEMGGGLFQVHLREVPLAFAVFK